MEMVLLRAPLKRTTSRMNFYSCTSGGIPRVLITLAVLLYRGSLSLKELGVEAVQRAGSGGRFLVSTAQGACNGHMI